LPSRTSRVVSSTPCDLPGTRRAPTRPVTYCASAAASESRPSPGTHAAVRG